MTTKDKLRAYLASRVEYEIECLFEDTQIEGNALAIGEPEDSLHNAHVRRELERGNEWAWCTVKVTCTLDPYPDIGTPFVGVDYLGCCQYASRRDFERGDYCADMRNAALDDLVEVVLHAATPKPPTPDPVAAAIVARARRSRRA